MCRLIVSVFSISVGTGYELSSTSFELDGRCSFHGSNGSLSLACSLRLAHFGTAAGFCEGRSALQLVVSLCIAIKQASTSLHPFLFCQSTFSCVAWMLARIIRSLPEDRQLRSWSPAS
ncbi:unnamed protein product [Polarella glacialis]|uniref:Uncharacterized protein n=1 Tax=Polarella glacialis TaxID=89957 RepID=A0A813J0V5_POLGL|nr:unnamed protein product [Polarella glacialis]|mmetsp:Transcript_96997/g.175272  ORF Transcript_96997/g.175272 Transcript_96997/m.175272 type:complete len:118 (+) Transcript_96997:1921-2274(+)